MRSIFFLDIPVTRKDLANAATDSQKADAVRSYLKSKGGRLEIVILDIPSLNYPTIPDHKERLLLFNVSILGGNLRWKGFQHVMVNAGVPKTSWTRQAGEGWMVSDLPRPQGYQEVPPPVMVSQPRPACFRSGEGW